MFRRRRDQSITRIFYAGDVHGSRVCWKKFVNAAAHYPADALVMGGDLTGKALVPIVREGDGSYSARVIGEQRVARTAEELDQMQQAISTNGMYPLIVDREEARRLAEDSARRDQAFEEALLDELRLWVEFADERLAGTETRAYVIPGNDDPWSIDEVLAAGAQRRSPATKRCGWWGRTRWSPSATPTAPPGRPRGSWTRTRSTHGLKRLADQLEAPERAIFNIHVPPWESSLDTAFEVDEDLRYVTKGGRPARGSHRQPRGAPDHRRDAAASQPSRSHPREQGCDDDRTYGGNQPGLRLR